MYQVGYLVRRHLHAVEANEAGCSRLCARGPPQLGSESYKDKLDNILYGYTVYLPRLFFNRRKIMSAVPAAFAVTPPEYLSEAEGEFVRTVLEHRGLFHIPTQNEFRAALDLMCEYEQQCAQDPARLDTFASHLTPSDLAAVRAKAFVMFNTIRPTAAQWHKTHTSLFGPLLCEPAADGTPRSSHHVGNGQFLTSLSPDLWPSRLTAGALYAPMPAVHPQSCAGTAFTSATCRLRSPRRGSAETRRSSAIGACDLNAADAARKILA
jgi:hypothetical protein